MSFDIQRFVEDVRALARRGVLFRHQGSDPETGMDCVNVPRWGYEQQGLRLPEELEKEFEAYHERPDGDHLLQVMRRWFIEIPFEETQPGDLLILYARRNPQHLAIKITNDQPPMVVEAYRSEDRKIGKLLEQPLDFRRRIAACFRFPDFDTQA